jgi:hypothetical protein
MKKVVFLAMLGFIFVACNMHITAADAPKGAILCGNDSGCPDDYYCGFAGVDQPATCIHSPGYQIMEWHSHTGR